MIRNLLIILFAITYCACGSSKEATLPQGEWKLQKLYDQDVSSLTKPVTIVFNSTQTKASGHAGCNQYFSSYTQENSSIKFSNTGATKMFCNETMSIEDNFMKALNEVGTFKTTDTELQFLSNGNVILVFVK